MSEYSPIHSGHSATQMAPVSKGRLWAGRIMSALPALFLIMDGVMKLAKPDFVVKATVQLGYAEIPGLLRGVALGWTLPARRAAARTHSIQKLASRG